jgi:hypothetical protein
MSALPSWRFEKPLKAFANCGLDFAGPFELKAQNCSITVENSELFNLCLLGLLQNGIIGL